MENDWGKAALNDIFWGQCAVYNESDWGISQFTSPAGETNISGKER